MWYSTIINDLLNVVGGISQLTDNGDIVNQLAAYYSLLNAKEQTGVERALMSNVFSADRFNDGQFRLLNEVVGKQQAWLAATRVFSTADVNAKLAAQLQTPQANTLLHTAQTLADKARRDVTIFAVISVAALVVALFFALLVASSIHRQLHTSLSTIEGMNGDLTQRLEVPGTDELSLLNRAYNPGRLKTFSIL